MKPWEVMGRREMWVYLGPCSGKHCEGGCMPVDDIVLGINDGEGERVCGHVTSDPSISERTRRRLVLPSRHRMLNPLGLGIRVERETLKAIRTCMRDSPLE